MVDYVRESSVQKHPISMTTMDRWSFALLVIETLTYADQQKLTGLHLVICHMPFGLNDLFQS